MRSLRVFVCLVVMVIIKESGLASFLVEINNHATKLH